MVKLITILKKNYLTKYCVLAMHDTWSSETRTVPKQQNILKQVTVTQTVLIGHFTVLLQCYKKCSNMTYYSFTRNVPIWHITVLQKMFQYGALQFNKKCSNTV